MYIFIYFVHPYHPFAIICFGNGYEFFCRSGSLFVKKNFSKYDEFIKSCSFGNIDVNDSPTKWNTNTIDFFTL